MRGNYTYEYEYKHLLLAAMLAVRCFGSGSSRRTLALACEEVDATDGDALEAAVALENNRYSSNNNNYNYAFGDVGGIADSNDNELNNDNYNYNKAVAKWQQHQGLLQQQKLYGNPIYSIYDFSRSQPQQRQQLRREFDDDPVNAGNDFRLQLSDLNAAVQGVGRFVVEHHNSPDQDNDKDNDNSSSSSSENNADSNSQPQQRELLLERRSRISRR
ncbi:GL11528 [Drosophila persimilis]|uniref:GL11528 n=1 Tax=Drosophila persimilis TaxID=7234 RepID=B4GBD3_DROPE|nr:GL11528 [Drosophila persimilis]